jgi:hypothetical protein
MAKSTAIGGVNPSALAYVIVKEFETSSRFSYYLQKEIGQNARKFVEQYANIHREVDIYVSKFEEYTDFSNTSS